MSASPPHKRTSRRHCVKSAFLPIFLQKSVAGFVGDFVAVKRFATGRSMMGRLNRHQEQFFYLFRLDEIYKVEKLTRDGMRIHRVIALARRT